MVTVAPGGYTVTQLNGHQMEVLTSFEADFHTQQMSRYMAENAFTAVSDLTDLDRLLNYELLVFRSNRWLSSGREYDGSELTLGQQTELRRQMKEISALISTVKNDLGLTRTAREKEAFESVGTYIVSLKERAKQHGVRRESQLTTAIVLVNELKSLVGTFDRSNELERRKLGLESEADIVEWIRVKFIPEFDAVDQHFRDHQQRFWIGDS